MLTAMVFSSVGSKQPAVICSLWPAAYCRPPTGYWLLVRRSVTSPYGCQQLDRLRQRGLQALQLAVDGDPQCLERARGRVNLAVPAAQRARHQFCQLNRGLDRPLATRLSDEARYSTRAALLAIAE